VDVGLIARIWFFWRVMVKKSRRAFVVLFLIGISILCCAAYRDFSAAIELKASSDRAAFVAGRLEEQSESEETILGYDAGSMFTSQSSVSFAWHSFSAMVTGFMVVLGTGITLASFVMHSRSMHADGSNKGIIA
jgi:hypothetical protein